MIKTKVPSSIQSQKGISEWIDKNWNLY